MKLNLKPDHVAGGFEWEKAPSCECELLAQAIDDHAIFVSNLSVGGNNNCYLFLLTDEGELFREDGVAISHCPWCGDRIEVKKKYPTGE